MERREARDHLSDVSPKDRIVARHLAMSRLHVDHLEPLAHDMGIGLEAEVELVRGDHLDAEQLLDVGRARLAARGVAHVAQDCDFAHQFDTERLGAVEEEALSVRFFSLNALRMMRCSIVESTVSVSSSKVRVW